MFFESQMLVRPKLNIFEQVYEFVQSVVCYGEFIKAYGALFLQLYDEARKLELQRIKSIRESYLALIGLFQEYLGRESLKYFGQSKELFEKLNESRLIEEMFDINTLLTFEQIDYVLKTTKQPVLNTEVLRQFIYQAKYEENIRDMLDYFVLKRYMGKQVEGKKVVEKEFCMYLTVDYFYTIYKSTGKVGRNKMMLTLPVEKARLTYKVGRSDVLLIYEEPVLLWSRTKKLKLLFQNVTQNELVVEN